MKEHLQVDATTPMDVKASREVAPIARNCKQAYIGWLKIISKTE